MDMSRSHRASRKALSRLGSHARGLGASSSRLSLLNRSHLDQSHAHDTTNGELINPDEFEEIAEIYDSIRQLHQHNNNSSSSS